MATLARPVYGRSPMPWPCSGSLIGAVPRLLDAAITASVISRSVRGMAAVCSATITLRRRSQGRAAAGGGQCGRTRSRRERRIGRT